MSRLFLDWLFHPGVLYLGVLLTAVPIVLHLVMRQRPKQLVFPALRLVRQRRETNRRRLRLQHLLLLLLRCLAVLLLAAALARPMVGAAQTGRWIVIGLLALAALLLLLLTTAAWIHKRSPQLTAALGSLTGLATLTMAGIMVAALLSGPRALGKGQQEPVAAVLVFDTSARMAYGAGGQTPLRRAQQIAIAFMDELPEGSEIAVLDGRGGGFFAADQAAAQLQIERLQIYHAAPSLPRTIASALELVKSSEKNRKEIYTFSDLTASAWRTEQGGVSLANSLEKARQSPGGELFLYMIDVGEKQPQNFMLGALTLSAETIVRGGDLQIDTDISALGVGGKRTIELQLEDLDPTKPVLQNGDLVLPNSRRRGRRSVQLEPDGAQTLSFEVAGLKSSGVYHGFLKIVGADALAADDIRYFTVRVQSAWPVLVAAPNGVNTRYLTEALAPYALRQAGRARFDCQTVRQDELANLSLADYAAICLLDPAPLTPQQWRRLGDYVRQGGSLAVFLGPSALGRNALPHASFVHEAARETLGAILDIQVRAGLGRDPPFYLAPRAADHRILAPFRSLASSTPWRSFPVFKYWALASRHASASTVIPYDNGAPALLEHVLGAGRVLVFTTPISDSQRSWNELPTGENAWPYFVLVNSMLDALVEGASTRFNYDAGEAASLPNRTEEDPPRYQLFPPQGDPYPVEAHQGSVNIRDTEALGAYRLKGNRGGPVVRGFSVNLPSQATRLERVELEQLDRVLGKEQYQLFEEQLQIERALGKARQGPELYPYLLLIAAWVLGAESLLANRFYKGA